MDIKTHLRRYCPLFKLMTQDWGVRLDVRLAARTMSSPPPVSVQRLSVTCPLRRRTALLVGGDVAALLLFAAIGRGSHAETNGLAGILDTAWPFLLGAPGSAAQGDVAHPS